MRKKIKFDLVLLAIIVIPLTGYVIMHGLAFIIPLSDGAEGKATNSLIYNMIIISMGLVIPYLLLKLLFQAAHIRNPKEKTIELSDLPKDKEQLAHKLDAQKNA